ncbi:inverted formin-2-like [Penaeus japonicus]|uniref:inverted formin-2-like n=1 Tax=Penaeus japonicus TaxID=27405 RepID=UPI001C70FD49|nr:inverted formin-2-like [Penaeus japonicus]
MSIRYTYTPRILLTQDTIDKDLEKGYLTSCVPKAPHKPLQKNNQVKKGKSNKVPTPPCKIHSPDVIETDSVLCIDANQWGTPGHIFRTLRDFPFRSIRTSSSSSPPPPPHPYHHHTITTPPPKPPPPPPPPNTFTTTTTTTSSPPPLLIPTTIPSPFHYNIHHTSLRTAD